MKIYQPFLYCMLKKKHYLGIYSATACCSEETEASGASCFAG